MMDPFPTVLRCSRPVPSRHSRDLAAVPSVPCLPSVYVRIIRRRAKVLRLTGNRGTVGTRPRINKLAVERSGIEAWNSDVRICGAVR